MENNNHELRELHQQVLRKRHIQNMLKSLRLQSYDLRRKVRELEYAKDKEQNDVEHLEGRSLAAFFYAITGQKEKKLDKERVEAYAAAVKYDAANQEYATVEEDIQKYEKELAALDNCEQLYTQAIKEKSDRIKTSGSQTSDEVLKLEERIGYIESQRSELNEAILEGNKARDIAESMLQNLNSAGNWGAVDLLGGSLITGLVKHSYIDDAQDLAENLQSQLRRFKTELADVTIQDDIQIQTSGFLKFTDLFFDNLFSDWIVLKHIDNSYNEVEKIRDNIQTAVYKLEDLLAGSEKELSRLKAVLDEYIINADL